MLAQRKGGIEKLRGDVRNGNRKGENRTAVKHERGNERTRVGELEGVCG